MKRTVYLAVMMGAVGVLAGCSTPTLEHGSVIQTKADGSKIENRSDYANYANTKLELAKKDLFTMECPPTGCVFSKLTVANPSAGNDIAAPAAPPKIESAAVGVAREVKETLGILVPIGMAATIGHSVSKIFSSFGGSVDSIASKIQSPQANVTTTNTASGGSAIGGNATNTTSTQTTSNTTTTSTTNTNSGNTSVACASGSAAGGTTTAQGAPSGAVACR